MLLLIGMRLSLEFGVKEEILEDFFLFQSNTATAAELFPVNQTNPKDLNPNS